MPCPGRIQQHSWTVSLCLPRSPEWLWVSSLLALKPHLSCRPISPGMPAVTTTSPVVAMATGKLLHPCVQHPASPRVLAATHCPGGHPRGPACLESGSDVPSANPCLPHPFSPAHWRPLKRQSSAALAAEHKGSHRAQEALKFPGKTKHKGLFHTEKPVTDSLTWEMREYTREASLSPPAPTPVANTPHTWLALFPVNAAPDADGARRRCQTHLQPE